MNGNEKEFLNGTYLLIKSILHVICYYYIADIYAQSTLSITINGQTTIDSNSPN